MGGYLPPIYEDGLKYRTGGWNNKALEETEGRQELKKNPYKEGCKTRQEPLQEFGLVFSYIFFYLFFHPFSTF